MIIPAWKKYDLLWSFGHKGT